MTSSPLHVAVLLGDPRLPYDYAPGGVFGEEELGAVESLRRALATLDGYRFTYLDDHGTLIDDLRRAAPDLALNLCDVGFGNVWTRELNVPALCELLDVPYTGAGPVGIVLSNDKAAMTAAAAQHGVRVPEQTLSRIDEAPFPRPTRYPTLIKPNVSGGSAGVTEKSLVRSDEEAEVCLRELRDTLGPCDVLFSEYLPGREYTVGLIGNPGDGFEVLPPLEVDFGALEEGLPPILTHGSKADPDSPYWEALKFRRAELDAATTEGLGAACAAVFERLSFHDYARCDFRENADGVPCLIDANINPTWYEGGKLSVMAGWAGHDYAEMLRRILAASARRWGLAS